MTKQFLVVFVSAGTQRPFLRAKTSPFLLFPFSEVDLSVFIVYNFLCITVKESRHDTGNASQ